MSMVRTSRAQAEDLWRNASDLELRTWASQVKTRFHDPQRPTYLVMGIINYTNICVAGCDYCAFYRYPHQKSGYLLTPAEVCARVRTLRQRGAEMIGFNGGFHPDLGLEHYEHLFAHVHATFPDVLFYDMTVAEFIFACNRSRLDYATGASRLAAAGVSWIGGGGAEILSDSFRSRHSPGKSSVDEYFKAQQAILAAGIHSTATMVIGFDESERERFDHLERLREFQDRQTHPLVSFLCWTYKPDNNKLGGAEIDPGQVQRWLAVCRIYLDNFVHIRASVLTQNAAALDSLEYGVNDFDLPLEDEVTTQAGAVIHADWESYLALLRARGYQPTPRGALALSPEALSAARRSAEKIVRAPYP